MHITVLKSKIHCATITDINLAYEGSITIDETLMRTAKIREHEKVLVINFTNGKRYETYAMKGKANSGVIGINGAGARYSCLRDQVTIMAFATIDEHGSIVEPKIVLVNEKNHIHYP